MQMKRTFNMAAKRAAALAACLTIKQALELPGRGSQREQTAKDAGGAAASDKPKAVTPKTETQTPAATARPKRYAVASYVFGDDSETSYVYMVDWPGAGRLGFVAPGLLVGVGFASVRLTAGRAAARRGVAVLVGMLVGAVLRVGDVELGVFDARASA
jgi:hypothetical protein